MSTRPASTLPPSPAQVGVRAAVLVGLLAACTGARSKAPAPDAPADDSGDDGGPADDTGGEDGGGLGLSLDPLVPLGDDADSDGVPNDGDCAPFDGAVYPGAPEVCGDGVVNDCDRRALGWAEELCAVQTEAILKIVVPTSYYNEGAYIGDLRGDGSDIFGIGVPSATRCDVIGYDEWGEPLWDCHRWGMFYLLELSELRPNAPNNKLVLPDPEAPGVESNGGHLPDRNYGSSLEGIGDLDGDGYADLILGNAQPGGGIETDEVWLFWGPEMPEDFDGGTRLYLGDDRRRCIGYDMEHAGDLTGDGIDDLIVGDPCTNQAWVWSGADVRAATGENIEPVARILDTGEEPNEFGLAMSGAHDLTGDGVADLVVSAPNPARRDRLDLDFVGVSEGPFAGDRDAADRVATVRTSLEKAEWSEHSIGDSLDVGDLNGDGYADLVVGDSEWYDSPGSAATGDTIIGLTTVHYGPLSGEYIDTEAEVQLYQGRGEVEAHTDFDGDGRDDVLVGSGSLSREGGVGPYNIGGDRAFLVYSPFSGTARLRTDADVTFRQPEDDPRIEGWGAQVMAVPDQSGDGVPDVIVGSIGDAFWLMPVPLPVR